MIKQASSISRQAVKLIENAEMMTSPFPHIIVDGIFSEQFYELTLSHIPPVSLLSVPAKFGMMKISEDDPTYRLMPRASQIFWSTFDHDIKRPICAALLKRYKPYVDEKLSTIFVDYAAGATDPDDDEFRALRGIVQCRTTGARMGAHVDKATSLFTYLFYFAPDDSLRPFGTIFYETTNHKKLLELYRSNRGIRAWFPSEEELAELELRPKPAIEFCRNRLVSYVNLPRSLHGAATDAVAPRYSMQSFCDLPTRITLPLFNGWRDPISPTGVFRGDD